MTDTHATTPTTDHETEVRSRRAQEWAEWAAEHYQDFAALEREWPHIADGFAQAAASETRDDQLVIDYTVALMSWFMVRRDWDTALMWLNEAVHACQALADDEMLAVMYNRGGLIYCLRGVYSEGFNWYSRALPLFEKLGDRAALATVEGNLGLLAVAMGDRTAEQHLKRASLLNMQLGNLSSEAQFVEQVLVTLLTRGWDAAATLAAMRLRAIAEETDRSS
ncbi:MAG: tetratricopeptide repeat protein [Anaerolineae bacterium]|nr:tetratricopeptide repeat protein [Thermoflexales bacterium]MDW8408779.1 tetratricopeptide repeat protein [Anaerolineae bacterium]